MGYFSNGTEGMDYQSNFCDRCVFDGDGEGPYCPVWAMHLDWCSESCADTPEGKAKREALNRFIPQHEGVWNLACRMWLPKDSAHNGFGEWWDAQVRDGWKTYREERALLKEAE